MTEKVAFFVLLAMAGMLAAWLWGQLPEERGQEAQKQWVKRVSALTFH